MSTNEAQRTSIYYLDYAAILPEAQALEASEVIRPTASTNGAVGAVFPKLPLLGDIRPRVLALPEFDIRLYDQLGPRARALSFAEVQCRANVEVPLDLTHQFAELRVEKRRLLAECTALAVQGCIPGDAGRPLRLTRSHRDFALHVGQLALYLHSHWRVISAHTRFTQSSLERVMALADNVHFLLASHQPKPRRAFDPRDMRYRMFTLVLRSCNEVEGAVSYLFRNEKHKIRDYVPQMFASHAKRDKKRPRVAEQPPASV